MRNGLVGGWHTVGCLRDQMPRLPELVLIFLGGGGWGSGLVTALTGWASVGVCLVGGFGL